LERTTGVGRARITADGIAELYQEGALRLRPTYAEGATEVVAINTAGGLTGGDRLDLTVALDAGAAVVVTTPACEKLYRSPAGNAGIVSKISLAAGSRLDWLPQPMIAFDGSRVDRRLDVEIAANATLLAVDGVILGRTAMQEELRSGVIRDGWRVRRGGRLIYADAFRAEGDMRSTLSGKAGLGEARALATVLHIAADAEGRLDQARNILGTASGETGASAWNGMLVVRLLAGDGQTLIADLAAFLAAFRALPLPRSWLC
jgi:urease accessory protein